MTRRGVLLVTIVLFALSLVLGFILLYSRSHHSQPQKVPAIVDIHPFSTAQIAAAGFPLFSPTKLPSGYRLQGPATNPENQLQIFKVSFVNDKGGTIYLTEQARVGTFDYGKFFTGIYAHAISTTSLGNLVVGYYDEAHKTSFASLVTSKTWCISNSDQASPADLKVILTNLQPAN